MDKTFQQAILHQLKAELSYAKRSGNRRQAGRLQKEINRLRKVVATA